MLLQNYQILRLPEVMRLTGLSRSSIYAYIKTGNFPEQKKLGARSVGWLYAEIQHWIEKIIRANQEISNPTSYSGNERSQANPSPEAKKSTDKKGGKNG